MYHLAAKVLKPCSFPQDPSQGVSREGLSFMLLSLEPFFVSPAPCLKFRVKNQKPNQKLTLELIPLVLVLNRKILMLRN